MDSGLWTSPPPTTPSPASSAASRTPPLAAHKAGTPGGNPGRSGSTTPRGPAWPSRPAPANRCAPRMEFPPPETPSRRPPPLRYPLRKTTSSYQSTSSQVAASLPFLQLGATLEMAPGKAWDKVSRKLVAGGGIEPPTRFPPPHSPISSKKHIETCCNTLPHFLILCLLIYGNRLETSRFSVLGCGLQG